MIHHKTSKRYFHLFILIFVFLIVLAWCFRYWQSSRATQAAREKEQEEQALLYQHQQKDRDDVKALLAADYQHYMSERHVHESKKISVITDASSSAHMMDHIAILQSRIEVYENYEHAHPPAWLDRAIHSRLVSTALPSVHAHDTEKRRSPLPTCVLGIDQGSIIPAVLISAVYSDHTGLVKAQVSEDVYDSRTQSHLLIPKGTVLIGHYQNNVVVGQQRLYITIDRLIFADGHSRLVPSFYGADDDASSGVPAEVNTHFWHIFGSALALSAVSVLAQPRVASGPEIRLSRPDTTNRLSIDVGSVAASGFSQTIQTILERNKNIVPTLFLPPGQMFHIVVLKDMCFVNAL